MNIKNSMLSATKSLSKNKMRTALTSIGVIIGVSSVIVMIGIGTSARISVRERVLNYGTNAISVKAIMKSFTEQDIDKLKNSFSQIRYITPVSATRDVLVKFQNKNAITQIFGVDNDYFKMKNWPLKNGRYFSRFEIISYEKIIIIGSSVQKELFGMINPIGKLILINNIPFLVVGVLEEMGLALSGRDFDDILFMPYTTSAIKINGRRDFDEMYIGTYNEDQIDETVSAVMRFYQRLLSVSPGKTDPVKIGTSKQKMEMAESITKTLSILLAGIASISLFVGGVGIMNIMLVSVSERTREIGIRMAIGAKGKDILMQFLVESVMLSSIGGLIGIILGIIIYYIITIMVEWPFAFSIIAIFISFIFSSAVGISFGFYPAKKAASLNPIDALRTE